MRNPVIFITLISLVIIISINCDKKDPTESKPELQPPPDPVTDIDGNVYQTVKIGNQIWMSENLKVFHYRNGDDIPNVTWGWQNLSEGACCYYNNDINNIAIYGLLYNGYAVNDIRNLAPEGWHVPTDEEWKELEMFLGMSQTEADSTGYRGTNEGGKLKEAGTAHWESPNTGATNESGFAALPGGLRNYYNGEFYIMDSCASFWASPVRSSGYCGSRSLSYKYSEVGRSSYSSMQWGYSIRCIRNPDGPTPPIADFTITPEMGTIEIIFTVDAGICSDYADPVDVLQVRWDWENDGVWDTNFSTSKIATHQYTTEGTKTIKLEVKDTDGLTDSTTNQIVINRTGTVTDIDGNIYKTVQIGSQWWMAENLKVTHYCNGDAIPKVGDEKGWSNLTTGAYCAYDNNVNIIAQTYGNLYNFHAVIDNRQLAPTGWHIPSDNDWQTLINYLGGNEIAGGKLKETGTEHWESPNTGATNESGFFALPGGIRMGFYTNMGLSACFWSHKAQSNTNGWYRHLFHNMTYVDRVPYPKNYGMSVRCVRN